jgi:hypothetical protein
MEEIYCKAQNRLESAIIIQRVSNQKILKIWYEDDLDPLVVKDLIIEEIELYRKNPSYYINSQL